MSFTNQIQLDTIELSMGKSNTMNSYKPQQYKTQYAPKKKGWMGQKTTHLIMGWILQESSYAHQF
jgi:hypothetical protein